MKDAAPVAPAAFLLLVAAGLVATVAPLASPMPELAILPALALPLALMAWRRPEIALFAIIFMIPFGAWRKIGPIDLPWVLAAFLIGLLVLRAAVQRRFPTIPSTALWFVFVGYLIVNVVSAGLSVDRSLAVRTTFLTVASGVFILLVQVYLTPQGFRHTLHRVVIWSVTLGSSLGLMGYLFGAAAFGLERPDGADFRAVGGAIDANNQAIMIVFALPLVVHLIVHAKDPRERWLMVGVAMVNILGVLITVSRSGFAMLVLVCLVMLFHYRRYVFTRRGLPAAVLVGVLGITAAIPMVPSSFVERQLSLLAWEDRSLSRRGTYLKVAKEAFLEKPWLGSGPGTFAAIYGRSEEARLFTSQAERLRRKAHNTYLEVLIGTGLVGLGLFLTLLAISLRHLMRTETALRHAGDPVGADLVACWRIGYSVLLVFLLMLSDMQHKYMLLGLGLSQACVLFMGVHPARRASLAPAAAPTTAAGS